MINEKQAKKYCSEDISKIENYDKAIADTTQTWHCHHRLEIQGEFLRNSREFLKKCGLYYNVPAWHLIFLTYTEHLSKHHIRKPLSKTTKQKMRKAKRGQLFWNNGVINKRCRDCPGPEWTRGRLTK